MGNIQRVTCDLCGKVGKFLKRPKASGIDLDGGVWSLDNCPECVTAYDKPLFERPTKRACRKCGVGLPSHKYFYCEPCTSKVEYSEEI